MSPSLVNLNGQPLDALPDLLEQTRRALYYGDAIFETLRVFDGRIPLLERHWARLSAGMKAVGLAAPPDWSADFFQKQIQRVAPPNARVRLTVWRSPGGRYAPQNDTPQFLIAAEALDSPRWEWPTAALHLGVCTTVRLPVDVFSNYKTLNAPRYVAAAREAQASGWDDALLLNAFERVCEATASNVFWWADGRLFTVPLSEGCVAGVMRATVLEVAHQAGIAVWEKTATPEILHEADEIFLTNAVRGIMPVRIFAGRKLPDQQTRLLFDHLQRLPL